MDTSFPELKKITDRYYETGEMPEIAVFVDLLKNNGIEIRKDDGSLHEVNFSVPKSREGLVLGLRYKKRDGSFTEDLFLFTEGSPIKPGYKGALERILPEYKGSHKGNPNS